ncbi:MAG: phospholipid carrier-dependent glycosyltransferase [Parcubacteria group bacterium]|nr:phospholipid carrier-dependent glycosyltransferase [Parcubacteria group bacterium]
MSKERILTFALLAVLIFFSAALHLYRISYPARPVFDEAYFATYAADYANGTAFFDIHPPLGKLLYAAVLSFFDPRAYRDAEFISVSKDPNGGAKLLADVSPNDYGDFPYVPLRFLSALFGIALPLVLYGFMRSISINRFAAFLAAFFVVLENSILLETRLILLNGMYLVFGFAALALYFKKRQWPVAAGLVWGMSLGVKLIGVVFLGPLLVDYFLKKENRPINQFLKFAAAGLAVYIVIAASNNLFFSVSERVGVWKSLGFPADISSLPAAPLAASALETLFSVGGYVTGDLPPFPKFNSPWYLWPLMRVPIPYSETLTLVGNPVVWFLTSLAVLFGLFRLLRIFTGRSEINPETLNPLSILLGGYLFSLLPFVVIERSTFLYHYFPALLFAACLLAWLVSELLQCDSLIALKGRKLIWFGILFVAAAGGFVFATPHTYGASLVSSTGMKGLVNFTQVFVGEVGVNLRG